MTDMPWVHNDGGRKEAGWKCAAGDCVCRSIAIATGKPYQEVYHALNLVALAKRTKKRSSARNGVMKEVYHSYVESLGWEWVPTMQIGSGCKVHLVSGELPMGRLIVKLSRHLTTVIDGVIHDTFDTARSTHHYEGGKVVRISHRCVYGYFQQRPGPLAGPAKLPIPTYQGIRPLGANDQAIKEAV